MEYSENRKCAYNTQGFLRLLKTRKPPIDNLTQIQRKALKEIKEDKSISTYPFDKGTGFVRIENEKAATKIQEQIGNTRFIEMKKNQERSKNQLIFLEKCVSHRLQNCYVSRIQ